MTFSERALPAAIAACFVALSPGAAQAMGLGNASTRAVMGETLRLTVPVRFEPGEQVSDECITADVYFGDDKLSAGAVSALMLAPATAAPQASTSGSRTLLVKTTALINEPVVTVYLSAGCQARITRKFIALADPPSGAALPAQGDAVTASQPILASEAELLGKPAAQKHHAKANALRKTASAEDNERSSARSKPKRTSREPASMAAATPASRLQLDPVEADALVSPDLRASMAMNAELAASAQSDAPEVQARREAAAALWRAMNATPEQQLRDQQRLQALEKRLEQVHAEGEQTRQNISLLQTRLRQIDGERTSSFGLYALGGLTLASLCLALYLYSQLRRKERQHADWWPADLDSHAEATATTAPMPDTDMANAATTYLAAPKANRGLSVATPTSESSDTLPQEVAKRMSAASPQRSPQLDTPPRSIDTATANPIHAAAEHLRDTRAVSVEELIDLEQQAEFFIVLGQDEAAIDLLEGHVHGSEGTIPLPYLKLLEIYHRLGRRDDYERVQTAFNTNFNGYAPTWESDLQQGRSLSDYPGIVDRLQALWSMPMRAMDVLEKSLVRPDAAAATFDLPAYRELLFLYAVARDLSDKQQHPEVPFTSPMPLTATRPTSAEPDVRASLDLDLRIDDLASTSGHAVASDHKP